MCTVLAIKKAIHYKIIITILFREINHSDQVMRVQLGFRKNKEFVGNISLVDLA